MGRRTEWCSKLLSVVLMKDSAFRSGHSPDWLKMSNSDAPAELGFIVLLAITASKAVGVIIDGKPLGSSGARAASRQPRA
jgi:hypothetical protein